MEKETIILEVKKSKNGVAVEIHEGTTLDVIIGIAETIQIIIEETGQKRKNIIADIETAVKVLEEGGKKLNSEILKVSGKSNPNNVAGAIAAIINEKGKVELQAIGAGAINQTVKAIAIARGYVASAGIDLICVPAFSTVNVEDMDRTGMKFIVRESK